MTHKNCYSRTGYIHTVNGCFIWEGRVEYMFACDPSFHFIA